MRWNYKIFTIIITLFFFNCSSMSDQELFNEMIKSIKEKNYSIALKTMEELLSEYPESNFTPQAIYEIAKIYHAGLIPNIDKNESVKIAINYYKKIFNQYKNSPEAERALFITGFIYANELNQLDSAKFNYELFLKKYPNSELSQSVKLELENLGKPADEILTGKMKSNAN